MIFKHPLKKWAFRLLLACAIAALATLYTGLIKSPTGRGFAMDLSDVMFLWGLSLFCAGLIYTTRFFGYTTYLRKWFSFLPFRKSALQEEDMDFNDRQPESTDAEKRDTSLVYASLLLIVFSIGLSYLR